MREIGPWPMLRLIECGSGHMVWSVASKLVTRLAKVEGDETLARDSTIKRMLGLAKTGISIGREDEPAGYLRWKAAENDQHRSASVGDLRYREFFGAGPKR